MDKKGFAFAVEFLVDLFILVFVLLLFFGSIQKIQNDDLHIQEREVREFALVKDAALASPGKLRIEYNFFPGFRMEVSGGCRIKMEKLSEALAPPASQYGCGVSDDKRIVLEKKKDLLEVGVG